MTFLYAVLFVVGCYLLYVLFLCVCAILVPKREYDRDSRFYRALLNNSTRNIVNVLRIHVHTTGFDLVPKDTKCLFVSNHRSNYDPILTWYVFRDWKLAYLSKIENFSIPVFGRFIRKCCFMAIDRQNIRKAVPTIRKAGELLERGEVSIGVYPEGTRSKKCVLLDFHDCMFRIAELGSAPIVVMTIRGTETIFRNIKRFRRSDVYLDVLEVIPAERVKTMRSSDISAEVRSLMENNLNGNIDQGKEER